jgi:hypothetical protein
MQASIAAYVPKDVEVLLFRNVGSSFGEAYNYGVREAFRNAFEIGRGLQRRHRVHADNVGHA